MNAICGTTSCRTSVICLYSANPGRNFSVVLTGFRLSELLALRWMDVDFLNGVIHVRHSLWRGELDSPKTEASAATLPMKAVLKATLMELRQRSHFTQPESFVFCNGDGQPLNPDVLRKDVLYRLLDKSGIERTSRASGFHAFRHCRSHCGAECNEGHVGGTDAAPPRELQHHC
ncbi:MAG TPA: tyrosine-type recombinase/integrase [Terriglobales bacterium]|nr:tyrosine-type recombinase/integrase [Terriglobales bacterium]